MRKKYTSKFSFNMFVIRDLTKKIMKKNMFKIYCQIYGYIIYNMNKLIKHTHAHFILF